MDPADLTDHDRDRLGQHLDGEDGRREPSASPMSEGFTRFSSAVARWTGSVWAFSVVVLALLGWLMLGPVFHWSSRWQLVATTATTLITFLMVFVIQATQDRHAAAMQLKLDELLSSSENASDRFIGADMLTQSEIRDHRDGLRAPTSATDRSSAPDEEAS
jgi:low affinity Fe/Cu permease